VPGEVRRAEVVVAADDEAEVTINGRPVPTGAVGWIRAEKLDVTASFRPGRNVIAVKARDGGAPPCAFLLEAAVTTAAGETVTVVSDGRWRVSEAGPEGWDQPSFDDRTWRAAEVVAPYGGGAWGRRVLVHEAKGE
jgi:alpha-L-rhamnosidase